MSRPDRPARDRRGALVLTARGRVVAAALAVLLVVLLPVGARTLLTGGSARASGPATGRASTTPATAATPSAGASRTTARPTTAKATTEATRPKATKPKGAGATAKATGTAGTCTTRCTPGIPHSGLVGTGRFTTSSVSLPAARRTATVRTYVVEVEGGVGTTPNDVARQVQKTLNDPRGWLGYRGTSFAAVPSRAEADFVVYLASPPTVDRMCAPLNVWREWSCEHGQDVVLNSDRWFLMTPTYHDLAAYRAYLVNHEVGHLLGRGHVPCPKRGARAPVMLQQSLSLQGCVRNSWPRAADLPS